MIVTNNILAVPFIIVIWSMDAMLCLISIRLALAPLPSLQGTRFVRALRELVDPLPQAICSKLAVWRHRVTPAWMPWLILIGLLIVARYLLMWFVILVF